MVEATWANVVNMIRNAKQTKKTVQRRLKNLNLLKAVWTSEKNAIAPF